MTEEERLREQWEEIMSTPLDVMFRAVLRDETEDREGASVSDPATRGQQSHPNIALLENRLTDLERLVDRRMGKLFDDEAGEGVITAINKKLDQILERFDREAQKRDSHAQEQDKRLAEDEALIRENKKALDALHNRKRTKEETRRRIFTGIVTSVAATFVVITMTFILKSMMTGVAQAVAAAIAAGVTP